VASEFGRTVYSRATDVMMDYGRTPPISRCTIFMTGAGIKRGNGYGKTDDYCYNIVENPVTVHDL